MKETATTKATTRSKSSNLDRLATKLQGMLSDRRDTFVAKDGMIWCDLGGSFVPTCGKMREFSSAVYLNDEGTDTIVSVDSIFEFTSGTTYEFGTTILRCYYEVYKKHTNLQFLRLAVRASGMFELTVLARDNTKDTIIQQDRQMFSAEGEIRILPRMALVSLPSNASLILKVRCLSSEGRIFFFRWKP